MGKRSQGCSVSQAAGDVVTFDIGNGEPAQDRIGNQLLG